MHTIFAPSSSMIDKRAFFRGKFAANFLQHMDIPISVRNAMRKQQKITVALFNERAGTLVILEAVKEREEEMSMQRGYYF